MSREKGHGAWSFICRYKMTISMKIKNDFGDLEALSPQLWKFNEKEPGLFDHHFPFRSCQWFIFEQNQWSLHKPGLPSTQHRAAERMREWLLHFYTSINSFVSLNTIQNPIAPHAWMDFRYDFRHILLRFHISETLIQKNGQPSEAWFGANLIMLRSFENQLTPTIAPFNPPPPKKKN